jgi:hypothetical protein
MTDMKRLLDESVPARSASLLRSAETDGPARPDSAEARMLAMIDALPSTAIAVPSLRKVRRLPALVRAGTLGGLAVVVVFGSVAMLRSTPSRTVPSAQPPVQTPSAASPAPTVEQSIRVDDLPSAAPSARPVVRPSSKPENVSSALEDELAAIDAARAALASGRPDVALSRVQAYQRRFRDGRFSEEGDALEVQALAESGRRAEAKAKGEHFLASRPGSPYERRVRSAITSDEVKP